MDSQDKKQLNFSEQLQACGFSLYARTELHRIFNFDVQRQLTTYFASTPNLITTHRFTAHDLIRPLCHGDGYEGIKAIHNNLALLRHLGLSNKQITRIAGVLRGTENIKMLCSPIRDVLLAYKFTQAQILGLLYKQGGYFRMRALAVYAHFLLEAGISHNAMLNAVESALDEKSAAHALKALYPGQLLQFNASHQQSMQEPQSMNSQDDQLRAPSLVHLPHLSYENALDHYDTETPASSNVYLNLYSVIRDNEWDVMSELKEADPFHINPVMGFSHDY